MHPESALLKALDEGRIIQLDSPDKAAALRQLAGVIQSTGCLPPSTDFLTSVLRREEQVSTYLAFGVAIPHAHVEGEGDLLCAIGWSSDGVQYGNTDEWSVHLVLMYCIPKSASRSYLSEIAAVAKALEEDQRVEFVITSSPRGLQAESVRLI